MCSKWLSLFSVGFLLALAVNAVADDQLITGYLLFEYYSNIGGSQVADLTGSVDFPDSPSEVEWREAFEIEINRADNYGTRASGYLVPPEDGNYTFWIASDDTSELWLGTDDDWATIVIIANVPGWNRPRQWGKYEEQQSAEITLEAGKKYCIMALHKEGGSGDNLAVAWAGPGIGTEAVVIGGAYLSPYLSGDDDPLILQYYKARAPQPADATIVNSATVVLEWAPVVTAASYRVYIGESRENVENGTGGTDKGPTGSSTFTPEGLQIGKTYYWRVDAVKADGVTIYPGVVWSFTISPKLASTPVPPDGALFVDPNIVLEWTPGSGATQHRVYFGDNLQGVQDGTGDTDKGTTTDVSFFPGPLEPRKTYYWRIDELDGTDTYTGSVWNFSTMYELPIIDPTLIGWWKLDEGWGTQALDWSGHGNHGTFMGDPQWATGYHDRALDFDGQGDYVETGLQPSELGVGGNAARTVSAWVYTRSFNGGGIFEMGSHSTAENFSLKTQSSDNVWRVQYWSADYDFTFESLNEWVHFTQVHDGNNTKIYANGDLIVNYEVTLDTTDGTTLMIGAFRDSSFDGLIDDFRLYNRAVTADEVSDIMLGDPLLAKRPEPADRSVTDIKRAASLTLSWSPGVDADQHDVYFGTDEAPVESAEASDITGIYRGRQEPNTYIPPEELQWGKTYYWRIDEYNSDATISKGAVWSFTIADFFIVDDFEYYDANENQIWFSWKDGLGYGKEGDPDYYAGNGTGAAVGDETTDSYTEEIVVKSGRQSMPFVYDNNKQAYAKYSESKLTLTNLRDWTEEGVRALTLWFRGYPAAFLESPPGTYAVTASGEDIAGTSDEFRFVFKQLSGDGTIEAQVLSVEDTDDWAKAGVMIRETLDAGSRFAGVYITPGMGCRFQLRGAQGYSSDTSITTLAHIEAPHWVKLERIGNTFNAYDSNDPATEGWHPLVWNPQTVNMVSDVHIGLALTSHNPNVFCEAKFSDVSATGSITGQWQVETIGASMRANAPEPMYVAVANNTGVPAVVYHDDPNAAQIDDWTEWNIDLEDFEGQGVDLTDVDSIAIGFGDRNEPQAGGSGKMYFDDIRLYRPRCIRDKVTLSEADLNGDCSVDFADHVIIAGQWLSSGPDLAADMNADSTVDLKDYVVLAEQWLNEQLWP